MTIACAQITPSQHAFAVTRSPIVLLPVSSLSSPTTPGKRFGAMLQDYFRSGWAFLIPYLAAYLLYAWLKWPVNSVASGVGAVKVTSESVGSVVGAGMSWVPCLLHVYWLFHALHLVLGSIALRNWLHQASLLAPPSSLILKAAPWIFLGLLFYIPGVYFEFPADPWEHYCRINEWSYCGQIQQHSAWIKFSYFLAYSLIGRIAAPLYQLEYFDLYYTGCCLLLCWQYSRLARAIGLGRRTSLIFVVLQALLLGNSLFGFYRYYGMSSSLFAQLGAVAITRIALEVLQPPEKQGVGRKGQAAQSVLSSLFSVPHRIPRLPAPVSGILQLAGSGIFLLPLIAFNHIQGLGIAGLGIAAVVGWRLVVWRRSMIVWLPIIAIALSIATILWYPRHPAIDSVYLPQGWLTAWYGFNLLSLSSPAFPRMSAILGVPGLLSLIAGLYLLRRNHIAAWLTVIPTIALCLPVVAIPFASAIAARNDPSVIITYHRLLFSIPTGLALVVLGDIYMQTQGVFGRLRSNRLPTSRMLVFAQVKSPNALLVLALAGMMLVPASSPFFNRLYHALIRPPADLSMRQVVTAMEQIDPELIHSATPPAFIATMGISFVPYSTGFKNVLNPYRTTHQSPLTNIGATIAILASTVRDKTPAVFLPQTASELYTPQSLTGYMSQHWQPREVAFEYSGGPEAVKAATVLGYRRVTAVGFTYFVYTTE